jgi:peptide/nickel transport system ATP-binding protein
LEDWGHYPLDGAGDNFLRIRGLSVTYSSESRNTVCALDNIALELRRGEVLGILGESGCGKSTLAHAILRLLPRNARAIDGELYFRGRDLLRLQESELREIRGREISLVSQDPALSLNPVITVGSQIGEVLRAHLPFTARQRREHVNSLLREVGFDDPAAIYGAYPHQLSGGQRQRIVIAQAVACRPALLIADEPTSKLDAPLRSEMVALLSQIREAYGTAILLISHDPTLVVGFADRVALMYAGAIVEIGKCSEVFARPLHPYTVALIQVAKSSMDATAALKSRFATIDGEMHPPASDSIGCRFVPRCSEKTERCTLRCPRETAPEPARTVSCFKYGE